MRKIADGVQSALPPAIKEPAALDEIRDALSQLGYPQVAKGATAP